MDGLCLTPFECNLEIWRQLWRVIERSDIVVQVVGSLILMFRNAYIQIVDARNPLLFYSSDLSKYVKEVNPLKKNVLLINKSDLLSSDQTNEWEKFFKSKYIDSIFW